METKKNPYISPQLGAINEYLDAKKVVLSAAEMLELDAVLMIAEAEELARTTTFSNAEALYFMAEQAASGKWEVNGHTITGAKANRGKLELDVTILP